MAGWSVPGYSQLKALGAGGFGDVVVAKHDASGVLVAIKYLHEDLLADPGFVAMFRGEAAVLASMDDPNVVRLYEYVESPEGAAIVMELVPGVSLQQILSYQGSTTPEAALVVLHGSLLGLGAAHRRGVVHRDYKPPNVLVNGEGVSKLTDFGLAARTGEQPVPAGTLAYVAPEQIAGAPATPASDVYSATATFYECLTGTPPFAGESGDLLRQHQFQPVPLDPVPAPLQPLVAAGMAKDPERRPGNALTFVTQLQTAAVAGYGADWHERGRQHLAEAALLLAALWPADPPPAIQGTAVEQVPLLQRGRHLLHRIGPLPAAIAIAAAVIIAAAITSLAGTRSHPPAAVNTAVVHKVPFMQHVVIMKRYKNGQEWYKADWGICHVSVKPRSKPPGHALYTVNFPYTLKPLRFVQAYKPPKGLYLALQSHPAVQAGCMPVLASSPPTTGPPTTGPPTTGPPTTKSSTPPTLTLPPDQTVEATNSDGEIVTYTATATDAQGRTLTPSCSPAPGSFFAFGTTTVDCSVTDSGGLTGTGSFTVTVQDTTPPSLTLPPDQTVRTVETGATVTYTATATDLVDGPVTPSCSPASESFFPLGTTTVNCSATDAHGNTATGSFTVTVEII
jgi:eukaryotic-like serine/threonine-protein kinase